ncbi:T9SS type A sorting domain-containing protein [Hymenobacter sp. BRD128]|uniref:M1 family aminopeptidase n=1 Tax=Hymenobacter sp. BRD128 TaxID=2675878 RepID=UPI00156461CB|nr:M1 family aminopeptidase [Hymenobacter sp. BRD128]QKG55515.1 T9SS type A sorting domain-containing protein [Hymenobacter sp. BRD128]
MRKNLLLLFWLVSLAGRPATIRAQLPTASPDAALACRQARLRSASATTAVAGVSGRHRLKMDRYDVQFYRLDLTLDNTSRTITGSALLRVRVGAQPLDSLAFELYQAPAGSPAGTATLVIDSVVAGGRRSPGVLRQGQAATAALAQPAPAGTVLNTRIYYHGTAPNGNTNAIGNALNTATSYRRDGVDYPYHVTWSLSEPFSAHEWFPCKQVLTDKADSSAVFVTTTLPNKVGSNGVLARTVQLPGGRVRYEWHENHPIDYYLISVAVAPYVEYVTTASPVGGPRVPIINYVYDQASLTRYQADIDRTAGFLENYSQLFGTYYFADEKYGHSMAPIGGGMEHQTMTTLQDFSFTLVAHELFHQWFGDNVTCASWEDIWLNEAFASYGEYLSRQAFDTPANARAWMDDAQTRAQSNGTGTVRVPDTTNVSRIFNYNLTYKKGAAVVHLLRYLCHDDARFFRVLRAYQRQLSGRTAHTLDLQHFFEAELGQPLDYFFQQWYQGEGFPAFNVRWNQVGIALYVQVSETASVPASTPFFQTEVDYQLTFQDGSTRTVRLSQTQASQGFTVPVSGTVATITVDPAGWLPDLPGTVQRDNALVLATRTASAAAIALYPNPARDYLTISGLATAATAEICDATGRVVQRQPLASPQLSTQALVPGLYLLRVLGPAGEALGQGRFVKE